MKKTAILFYIFCVFLIYGCNDNIFAPDRLYFADEEGRVFVTNRSGNELLLLNPDLKSIKKKITFDAPVADIKKTGDDRIWVVCEGSNGKLYELDADKLSIISQTELGYNPSAVLYNPRSNSLWSTQRFNNSVWEIDPATKEVLSKIEVGREPVDMITFASDSFLLIANNLPEMSSLDFPVTAQLSVVDVSSKQMTKRIMLPNGSTDVKAITMSSDRSFAYVTHILARYQLPTNQVDRGWMCTNALSIIDLNNKELFNTVLLDTPQKGSANPWGVTVSPDDKYIIVAASGVDELICIDRNALHEKLAKAKDGIRVSPSSKRWEDIPDDAGFLYGVSKYIITEGKGPRTVIASKDYAYTTNYFTGELVKIDLKTEDKTIINLNRKALASTPVGKGNMYFYDATIGFQGWQSCTSCHPNDARSDGLNWDLLNDGMGNPKNTKTLVLSHETPPSMITGIRKDAETAVRSGLKHILFAEGSEEISTAMDVYLKSLIPVPSPYLINGELSETAQRGKTSFDNHCASCHSGSNYTDMKQYNVNWATGKDKEIKMDVPTLREVWRTAPYLYDGRAYTMREMLEIHGPNVSLSDKELDDLAEYVLSL
ncbi:MAG: c-type cytochrome [Prevotella sp.]|jgi:DNA-binding beta-propeller fold protein YncE/mono/diheme cytochrome c family protein|nr:c-type cytochrome [Prevotella sp.]